MKALIDWIKLEFFRAMNFIKWPVWWVILAMTLFVLIGTSVLAPEWSWVALTAAFIKFVFWLQEPR